MLVPEYMASTVLHLGIQSITGLTKFQSTIVQKIKNIRYGGQERQKDCTTQRMQQHRDVNINALCNFVCSLQMCLISSWNQCSMQLRSTFLRVMVTENPILNNRVKNTARAYFIHLYSTRGFLKRESQLLHIDRRLGSG